MKQDTELQKMLTTLPALEEAMLAQRAKGDLDRPRDSASLVAGNWRALVQRFVPRPESAVWLMLTDLLFFADAIPFLWPFLVVPGFVFGSGGVLAIEKLKANDRPEQCLLRALLAGGLVALPTPIVGTLSGAVALMVRLSGWSPMGSEALAAPNHEDAR